MGGETDIAGGEITRTVTCDCILIANEGAKIFGLMNAEYVLKIKQTGGDFEVMNTKTTSNFTIINANWVAIEEEQYTYDVPSIVFNEDSEGNNLVIVETTETKFTVTMKNVAIPIEDEITATSTTIGGVGGNVGVGN